MNRVIEPLSWPLSLVRKLIANMSIGISVLVLTTIFSLMSTLALLSSSAFSAFVSGGLARIGFTTVYQASTLKADRLAQENSALIKQRQNISNNVERLTKQNSRLLKQRQNISSAATRTRKIILDRAQATVARNLTAMPAESVPVAGIAIVLGVTALEVNDMCAIVEDLDKLMLDLDVMTEKSEGEKLCLSWRKSLNEQTNIVNARAQEIQEVIRSTSDGITHILKVACRSYGICDE